MDNIKKINCEKDIIKALDSECSSTNIIKFEDRFNFMKIIKEEINKRARQLSPIHRGQLITEDSYIESVDLGELVAGSITYFKLKRMENAINPKIKKLTEEIKSVSETNSFMKREIKEYNEMLKKDKQKLSKYLYKTNGIDLLLEDLESYNLYEPEYDETPEVNFIGLLKNDSIFELISLLIDILNSEVTKNTIKLMELRKTLKTEPRKIKKRKNYKIIFILDIYMNYSKNKAEYYCTEVRNNLKDILLKNSVRINSVWSTDQYSYLNHEYVLNEKYWEIDNKYNYLSLDKKKNMCMIIRDEFYEEITFKYDFDFNNDYEQFVSSVSYYLTHLSILTHLNEFEKKLNEEKFKNENELNQLNKKDKEDKEELRKKILKKYSLYDDSIEVFNFNTQISNKEENLKSLEILYFKTFEKINTINLEIMNGIENIISNTTAIDIYNIYDLSSEYDISFESFYNSTIESINIDRDCMDIIKQIDDILNDINTSIDILSDIKKNIEEYKCCNINDELYSYTFFIEAQYENITDENLFILCNELEFLKKNLNSLKIKARKEYYTIKKLYEIEEKYNNNLKQIVNIESQKKEWLDSQLDIEMNDRKLKKIEEINSQIELYNTFISINANTRRELKLKEKCHTSILYYKNYDICNAKNNTEALKNKYIHSLEGLLKKYSGLKKSSFIEDYTLNYKPEDIISIYTIGDTENYYSSFNECYKKNKNGKLIIKIDFCNELGMAILDYIYEKNLILKYSTDTLETQMKNIIVELLSEKQDISKYL